jgi:hypothetical protein
LKGQDKPGPFGTKADVDAAITALSPADGRRLEQFARYKMKGLGKRARGNTHEDLLQQAMLSICEGTEGIDAGRRWPMAVPFPVFVAGVMRSIASHWADSYHEQEAQCESDLLIEGDSGSTVSPLDNAPSSAPALDRGIIAKEELAEVLALFKDDDNAIIIIEGWEEGWTPREIIELMTKAEYAAGVKRIRYKVKAK